MIYVGPRDGLPVSPSLELVQELSDVPRPHPLVDRRVLFISALAILLGVAGALASEALIRLISLITNLSFFGRLSLEEVSPADANLGLWVILVPVVGGLLVGLMARYGSKAIRGHGIPEAMEQVLTNQSRIPARTAILKPLSAAVSIGTGGPFGAEGPIIATGAALGSIVGQVLHTSAIERKTLLAAGAAAGMSATFIAPVSAVLLAVELLLFEYRPRTVIPVALASVIAAGLRILFHGAEPVFAMPALAAPPMGAIWFYIILGAATGVVAVGITKLVYWIEDSFERLPVHWMWWPAIGAIAVGVVGYFSPRTLGVGYSNISDVLNNRLAVDTVLVLGTMKLVSWSVSLGSGTSGGTLAPLLTIGGCLGLVCGNVVNFALPQLGVDVRVAALVGMAAVFAGATRALLTSVVFVFEVTLQPLGLLPLLGGCSASYLVSCLMMRNTIMTEKIARRGVQAIGEYQADLLDRALVRDAASSGVVTLPATRSIDEVRTWLASGDAKASHQGYPVVDDRGMLVGVVTRRDFTRMGESLETVRDLVRMPPKYIYDDCTLRQAVEHMAAHGIGRLPVVSRLRPTELVGMITRSDVLSIYRRAIVEREYDKPTLTWPRRIRPPAPTREKAERSE